MRFIVDDVIDYLPLLAVALAAIVIVASCSARMQALLVTRDYKTADRIAELTGLRDCVNAKQDELREATGVHPKWQTIDTTVDYENWQKYDPSPAKPAAKKK